MKKVIFILIIIFAVSMGLLFCKVVWDGTGPGPGHAIPCATFFQRLLVTGLAVAFTTLITGVVIWGSKREFKL